jgi:hypothetical protein
VWSVVNVPSKQAEEGGQLYRESIVPKKEYRGSQSTNFLRACSLGKRLEHEIVTQWERLVTIVK